MSIDPQLSARLTDAGETELLAYLQAAEPGVAAHLAKQLEAVNLAEIAATLSKKGAAADGPLQMTSPPAIRLDDAAPRIGEAEAIAAGEALLSGGKVAALLVAGGQGTRLGFDHPKGMFPIGPVTDRTLFQIFVEKLIARGSRYGAPIPLFLMTSPATHDETVDFFAANDNFGLPQEQLHIFCQGTMPAVDAATGKLLLADPGHLALSPDGHGGTLAALVRNGCLAEMNKRGLEVIYYFQVDNPLADVCEPLFLGYHRLSGSEMSTQVVAKQRPEEKVGVLVEVDGKLRLVEYSELSEELAAERDASGSLKYWAGNIAIHGINVEFLNRMADDAESLPWHLASKKVPYCTFAGEQVEPESPNGIKFERFIFDLLPHAKNAIVVEISPATTFAPVKNADGAPSDTPSAARAALTAIYANWLTAAGVTVEPGVPIEISPLYALDAEELKSKAEGLAPIVEPTVLGDLSE
ncbi:UTP--glucose-1-phosphate uridylyltransferase [Blastopirellula sp. JC732]|uniref:UTP--glucose-1-phosphate uridylyltransferase n=1 Tax=Blastopirellula sediminis TaxID=2894196 RepID=A0A9X1SHU7_9BACT|nr:UTP--glucose-1-phosphate uridylyltransferase [Blastopirellula sediminis]MCC9605848.1 UTP--glucose-1-phosphate uridylyltransferase [Blastopirellula sediminis]MCC9630853.1 UTP--glucose-1-phosphate uridylyltransferase [Blastopirellula sediminis]